MKQPLEIASNIEVDLMKNVSDVVRSKILSSEQEDREESFFVCDLGDIVQKYKVWCDSLPRVKPYFDIRCNDDTAVLTILSQLGVGFNCSSKGDIKKVLDLGVDISRIIYSSPCKLSSQIKFAASHGVDLVAFESEAELHKIKSYHPNARLLLKVLPAEVSAYNQSLSFGCRMNDVATLLLTARQLQLNVVGVSIQTRDASLESSGIGRAVAFAHSVFELAKGKGFNMSIVDIGDTVGKKSVAELSPSENFSMLQMALDDYFPAESGVTIIAEVGRFFVQSAFTLVTKVMDRAVVTEDFDGVSMANDYDQETTDPSATLNPDIIYYLNDGVYQSFSGILYDNIAIKPALAECERFAGAPRHVSCLLGPTHDSLDCILPVCYLPELFVGDWILFRDMGAYVMAGSMELNEMTRPKCHYTMCAEDWIHLCCCSSAANLLQLNEALMESEPATEWLDV
jgi:ornithine decarboxylase